MALSVEIYEDSGAVLSGHGTTRIITDNIGWKSSGLDETNSFAYYPLRRPEGVPFTYSFKKYNYFKISGTHAAACRPVIIVQGGYNMATALKLYYKLSNTYEEPTNAFDGDLIYVNSSTLMLYPKLSTVGPEDTGASYVQYLTSGTTYYTQYLVTQLFVQGGGSYQNLPDLKIGLYLQEFENTDL